MGLAPGGCHGRGAIGHHLSVDSRLASGHGLELVLPVRAALILMLLACLLVWAIIAPEWSATSRFLRSRPMVFLGTYSWQCGCYPSIRRPTSTHQRASYWVVREPPRPDLPVPASPIHLIQSYACTSTITSSRTT